MTTTTPASTRAADPEPPPDPFAPVVLHYRGPLPLVLPSPSGGEPYELWDDHRRLTVRACDVPVLRRSGWFIPVRS